MKFFNRKVLKIEACCNEIEADCIFGGKACCKQDKNIRENPFFHELLFQHLVFSVMKNLMLILLLIFFRYTIVRPPS